jgi:hypothetical protein
VRRVTVSARRDLSTPWYQPNDLGHNARRAKIGALGLAAAALIGGGLVFWLLLTSG